MKKSGWGSKVPFWVLVLVLGGMAYFGGIAWQGWRFSRVMLETPTQVVVTAPEQKAEALRLIDEAAKARHEERYDAAWELALRVQESDPGTAGLELLMAELAFQRRDSGAFRKHAKLAALLPESAAGAKLLLALERWRSRVVDRRSDEESGRISADLLAEAAAAQPSVDVTWFFRGDLLRQIGKPSEAHRALLGSMHRQAPWRSSALLAAKIHFAQSELSGVAPLSRPIGSDIGLHPGDISRGRIEVSAKRGPLGLVKLAQTLTVRQLQWILEDQAKQSASSAGSLPKSTEQNIPYAILPKLESQPDYEL